MDESLFCEILGVMDSFKHQACLGIPVPLSVKALVSAPPICLPTRVDCETIEILENLGNLFGRPKDEIKQAQNLAAGLSDIVIILQRPRDRYYHPYDVGFDEFVKSCPTLQAVDELIRFATRGARSIHTTTVLDAFSYQPDKKVTKQDQKCHEALARILKIKTPKVILRCHRDEYKDEWLKCIEQKGEDYKLGRKEITIAEDTTTATTVVLQTFHPSCAVNNADCRPEYRALLTYHFVAAFGELRCEFKLPGAAEEIRELCRLQGHRTKQSIPKYKPWQAASAISWTLKRTYEGPFRVHFLEFANEPEAKSRSRQIKAFIRMYIALIQLFEYSTEPGGLAIARILLFLWANHFQEHPLYERIMSRLILRGNEQTDWLPSKTRPGSDPRPLIRESLENELRSRMVDGLAKHNTLIREYLSETGISGTNNPIHIRASLSQCETFISDDTSEEGDLDGLIRSLGQLTCVFEDHDA
jgi:hypothetical protein